MECGSPFAWHQSLTGSVDDLLVAGGFAGHDGEQAFTRGNGAGSMVAVLWPGVGGRLGCLWLLCIVQSAPQSAKLDSPSPICYIA